MLVAAPSHAFQTSFPSHAFHPHLLPPATFFGHPGGRCVQSQGEKPSLGKRDKPSSKPRTPQPPGHRGDLGCVPTPLAPACASGAALARPIVIPSPSSNLQESDRMERISEGCADMLAGSGAEHVRLVSLGGYCGPKLSFQKMGRGAETLPFDWLRTRVEGILHFLRNDFDGFFQWESKELGYGHFTMFRSRYHSFWHDDPDDAGMQERYTRRMKRFWEIDAKSAPVLFVRVAVSTDELALAEELLLELQTRFGPEARLLFLLDAQHQVRRATINGNPNLLISCLRGEGSAPFIQQVREALDWTIQKPLATETFANVASLAKLLTPLRLNTDHYSQ